MHPRALLTRLLLIALWAGPVAAGPYKCRQSDGSVAYQAAPCDADATGGELTLDPGPSRRGTKGKAKDYSVAGQLKALEAERKQARRARDKAATEDSATKRKGTGHDRAKCAKNRAEAARWRQKARSTYRDRDELDYREQKLEYYQALVDQYCRPD